MTFFINLGPVLTYLQIQKLRQLYDSDRNAAEPRHIINNGRPTQPLGNRSVIASFQTGKVIINTKIREVSQNEVPLHNEFKRAGRKKPSETDLIKSKIPSKTSRGKKDSTKRQHDKHQQRQPDEQQFPTQVVTG